MRSKRRRKSQRESPAPAEETDPDTAVAADETAAPVAEDESPAPGGHDAESEELADGTGTALVESPEEALQRLTDELEALKDRHLRTVAEYDNYRKRTARERKELWSRAQAEVVANILDALDDFGRVLDADLSAASAEDVVHGVELVERKLMRQLEGAGLERVGSAGEAFDPNHHEAIGSLPAESAELDHTVGAVLQLGYRFGGARLRPAKVQVSMWQGDDAEAPGQDSEETGSEESG